MPYCPIQIIFGEIKRSMCKRDICDQNPLFCDQDCLFDDPP